MKKQKNKKLARNAELRRSEWIDNAANNDPFVESNFNAVLKYIKAYFNGTVLLKHPSVHDFRTKCDKP